MRFSRLPLIAACACLLSACASARLAPHYGPRGFWRPNRYDHRGREQGRWRTYYDSARTRTQPFTAGRYRHGQPVRTFRYYAPTGVLDHTERYSREEFCEVTYWYPGGQVARRGHAQWVTGGKGVPRFYWFGPWTSYAESGQTTGIQTYTDGALTRAETYEAGQLTLVETYRGNRLVRAETYDGGRLLKVESFENGRRTGTTGTL